MKTKQFTYKKFGGALLVIIDGKKAGEIRKSFKDWRFVAAGSAIPTEKAKTMLGVQELVEKKFK